MNTGEFFKLAAKAYTEGPDSTFTHKRKERSVDDLIQAVKSLPVSDLPAESLRWNLEPGHKRNDDMATWKGDLSQPIVVTDWYGKPVVIDGMHRLTKLLESGAKSIKARVVSSKMLAQVPLVENRSAESLALDAHKTAEFTALPHQQRVAEKLKSQHSILAAHSTGSGKSVLAINAAKELGLPLLVIGPASMRAQFKQTIADSGFTGESNVVSYEFANKFKDDAEFRALAARSLVAMDEVQRTGGEGTARSKLPAYLPSKKLLLLSGTAVKNAPTEFGPILSGLTQGELGTEFVRSHIEKTVLPRGPVDWLMGRPNKILKSIRDPENLAKHISPLVDFYDAGRNSADYPEVEESVVEVPMSDLQTATYKYMMSKFPRLAFMVRSGIYPEKRDAEKMRTFLTGPRRVSNSPEEFHSKATPADARKIIAAADAIEERYKADPANFRGVAFSNFLGAGVHPLAKELERRGIASGSFTGEIGDEAKRDLVSRYNDGKLPVLLLSPAGGEGLSLTRTSWMGVLDPSWNQASTAQAKARVVRYKSHAGLPPGRRKVEIQSFVSKLPQSTMQWAFGQPADRSADDYLMDMSADKERLNKQFMTAIGGGLKTGSIFQKALADLSVRV